MNIKYISFLLSALFLSVLFYSCNKNDTTTSYGAQSKDAQIYSFTLTAPAPISSDSLVRAQDSIRFIQVNNTNYAIDQISGVIYNPDSMPFGTKLNKALVKATFNPTYGISKIMVTTPDSIGGYAWNTSDSINFSKGEVKFQVYAADGVSHKNYDIDIRIHKINPDLIPWTQTTPLPIAGKSKTLLYKNTDFFTFIISAGNVYLYTMERTGSSWTKENLTGLPATVNTESIFIANDLFYAVDSNGDSYSSTNGLVWSKVNNGKRIDAILGVLPSYNSNGDMLLVAIKYEDGKYRFGKGLDLASIDLVKNINRFSGSVIPENFPITGAAAYTNFSTSKTDRMLMLSGGANSSAVNLSNTWLVKNVENGVEITTFESKSIFKGGLGLSNFIYDNLYYVMESNQFYTSDNWGDTWSNAPDEQELSKNVAVRLGQTVIVDSENNIWIFGGISSGRYLNEVWKGRLNKLNS